MASDSAPVVDVLVLTEDTGAGGWNAAWHATRHGLLCADPATQTQRLQPSNRQILLRRAAAHAWRSRGLRGNVHRVALIEEIATQLSRNPTNLVVFHVDADCAWRDRPSERVRQFADLVADVAANENIPVARVRERVFLMLPYWCIEAWALQNLDALARVEVPAGEGPLPIDAWREHRARIDDHPYPKRLWTRDRHNVPLLSSGWPRGEVLAAGASFAAFVRELAGSVAVATALRATHRA